LKNEDVKALRVGEQKSDDELIRGFRKGDDDAFTEFVRRHQDVVYRLALRNLQDNELAREAAQEVFLRAWRKLGRWRLGGGKPFTWLYRTMRNVCLEMGRKQRGQSRLSHLLEENLTNSADDSETPADHLERRVVEQLVDALPKRQRAIVMLHIYEDLTLSDVAAVLGIPLGTVKSNYHKALGNLRRAYTGRSVASKKAQSVKGGALESEAF
jgi:RNA polymerase sigma-70 factor (ECF subfamily)